MNFSLLLNIVKYSPIEFSINMANELIISVPVPVPGRVLHTSGFWTVFQKAEIFSVDWNDHDQLCEWYYIPL